MERELFKGKTWQNTIDVYGFILDNYTPYYGDESFLAPATKRTKELWNKCLKLIEEEKEKGGLLDVDLTSFSGINNFKPGYIDKENELIYGLQTDAPLKRIVNPYGGMRVAEKALKLHGYTLPEEMRNTFLKYRKTHNDGVFDVYTPDIRKARHTGLITGLPDAYGRGRIIGDYRRVALYGTDFLIVEKLKDYALFNEIDEETIRLREEIMEQIRALHEMTDMAASYGVDISTPAESARDAIQAVYMAYLAGTKENNGAATSLGRVSTFLDIYIERDLQAGLLTEEQAQELIDDFVIKLRLIRHLRTPEYDELFGGDPTWVTESIGGMASNGQPLVTKTSFRILNTLINLGASPEPNLTILWDENLPEAFKKYCAKISILTDAIQYENDTLMRSMKGSDYGIACCVSALDLGSQMQYFGARCNIAKALLYAINEGRDEITGELVVPNIPALPAGKLNYEKVWSNYIKVLEWTLKIYVDANNIIHYMHDKYAYEASQMALHDTLVQRLMAFGIAGFSVAIDSLSAIKYAKVTPIRNEQGITTSFNIVGEYPKYGNDDDHADEFGRQLLFLIENRLRDKEFYRKASPTLSILTITSNVVYGKKTGATPDGRAAGTPFAPGANPMHNRDQNGALASLNSVAKMNYRYCLDGISNTITLTPQSLGNLKDDRINNLVYILDGYFSQGGHHLNVNVLNRETLLDAYEHPEKYSTLTIRVSGYAVNFCKLSKEQQLEVIQRTFHEE